MFTKIFTNCKNGHLLRSTHNVTRFKNRTSLKTLNGLETQDVSFVFKSHPWFSSFSAKNNSSRLPPHPLHLAYAVSGYQHQLLASTVDNSAGARCSITCHGIGCRPSWRYVIYHPSIRTVASGVVGVVVGVCNRSQMRTTTYTCLRNFG